MSSVLYEVNCGRIGKPQVVHCDTCSIRHCHEKRWFGERIGEPQMINMYK